MTSYLQEHSSSVSDASALGSLSVTALSSVSNINSLPSDVQDLVRDAFRYATRLCFISLIPWCALSFIGCIFLSKIRDTDREPAPVGAPAPAQMQRYPPPQQQQYPPQSPGSSASPMYYTSGTPMTPATPATQVPYAPYSPPPQQHPAPPVTGVAA